MTLLKTLYGIIFVLIWGGRGVDNRLLRSEYSRLVSINTGRETAPHMRI